MEMFSYQNVSTSINLQYSKSLSKVSGPCK